MERKRYFVHKKTGKLYSLVSNNFLVKDIVERERIYTPDSFEEEYKTTYKWNKGLVLYKAEYECPDGPYFARLPEDFKESFEEVSVDDKGHVIFQSMAMADYKKDYEKCYYLSRQSRCLLNFIDYGLKVDCCKSGDCPMLNTTPKDDFIEKIEKAENKS